MKYTIIFIPGLFDSSRTLLWLQRRLLRSWRSRDVHVELFVVGWMKGAASFDERLEKLLERIDELAATGKKVVLVGSSAGASMALNAHAKRRNAVAGVVSICGQLKGIEKVPEPALDLNPRFRESLEMLTSSLKALKKPDRARILALRPWIDGVVQPEEAFLEGAHNVRMPIVGHLAGIGFALLFEGHRVRRFIAR